MKLPRPFLLFGAAILLAACATKSFELRTFNIAGGRAVDLPMNRDGSPQRVENDDFRIEVTGFMLDSEKGELIYTFGLTAKKNAPPRSVTVEDVSGERAEIMVIDSMPELDPNGYWKGQSFPRRKGDFTLGWLTDTGDTYKVFRFSITTADGRPFIIHQGSIWSGTTKPMVREIMGIDSSSRPPLDPRGGN